VNNYSLPFEILVHNQVVHKSMLMGLDKPSAQYMKTYAWTVGQPFSGTTVSVECRIDPMNTVHKTSQKTFVTVIGAPQKELTTRQPSGEQVMPNPKPVLPKSSSPDYNPPPPITGGTGNSQSQAPRRR